MLGSGIEWCDATFNIVWGCEKVSPACLHCYAEKEAHRRGFEVWGPRRPRRTLSAAYWREPLKWNKVSAAAVAEGGYRLRVFTSSMADVFEDHPTVNHERARLWELTAATPDLDWLVLTKRPENFERFWPWADGEHGPPANIWLGVTVESEDYLPRVELLMATPAARRWVSYEPALTAVDFSDFLPDMGLRTRTTAKGRAAPALDWIIVGGESGRGDEPRPFSITWARNVLADCRGRIPVFVKQLGSHVAALDIIDAADNFPGPVKLMRGFLPNHARAVLRDWKGKDTAEWPADLVVREFPASAARVAP